VADDTQGVLERHGRRWVSPVVRDLAKSVTVPRTQVVQGAMTVPKLLAHARETGANENHAVRVIALLRNDRLLNRWTARAGLSQPSVLAGPVVIAIGAKLGLRHHFSQISVREAAEHRRLAQVSLEGAFAVNLVDVQPQLAVVPHQVAQ